MISQVSRISQINPYTLTNDSSHTFKSQSHAISVQTCSLDVDHTCSQVDRGSTWLPQIKNTRTCMSKTKNIRADLMHFQNLGTERWCNPIKKGGEKWDGSKSKCRVIKEINSTTPAMENAGSFWTDFCFPGKRSNKNIQSFRQTMWFKLGLHDLLIIIPLALKTDRTLSPFSFLSLFLNKICRQQQT